jgi:hypothetical protein
MDWTEYEVGGDKHAWWCEPFEIVRNSDDTYDLLIFGDDEAFVPIAQLTTLEAARGLAEIIQGKLKEEELAAQQLGRPAL